ADIIYLVGTRRVAPVTVYLAYAFGKLGIRTVLVDQLAGLGPEQLAGAGPRDTVLAISYAPYASATIDLVRQAADRGAR
ncbi:MurR/RpiR family transcriptional regulator, partial [Mycobacterium tuberculosis]|nr:MurR/RpiR family transcriptional regulator [Mycobacterium tuberculosis]